MRLTVSQFPAHLGKILAPLYVIAGEEPLLIMEALDALRAAARKQGHSERQTLEADRYFKWEQLAEACASLSLFASRRIIEVNLPSGAPGVEGGKALQALAKTPPQDVLFILTCGEIEYRNRQGAWYSALETAGAALYVEPVKGAELPAWIAARFKAAAMQVEPDAIQLLAERTEGNLLACAQDIEKLKLLHPGQRITADLLARAVADSARFEAFDLNDRWLVGDAEGSVRSLSRLREEGTAILEILGAVAFGLRQLAKAAGVYAQSRDANIACERAGIFNKKARPGYIKALPRTRPVEALAWLSRCARIDQQAKSGHEAAAWEDLLTLILAASGAAKLKSY